jgi:hypothetical protein
VGSGLRLAPRKSVQPVADPDPHQLVPRGVELDLVDPVPVPVVGSKHRLVLVRLEAPADRLRASRDLTDRQRALLGPLGPLAAKRLDERPVLPEDVVILERR